MKTFFPAAPTLSLAVAALVTLYVTPAALAEDPPAAPKEKASTDAPGAEQERVISLVLLLSEPRDLSHETLTAAASAAAGERVGEEVLEEKPPYHCVKLKSGKFVISDVKEPYFEKPEPVAAGVKDKHLGEMILKHRGWIAVDWLGKGEPEDVCATYQQIGKMIAHLAGRDALAVYSPELDSFADFNSEAKATLSSADPLALFPASPDGPPSKETAAPAGAPEGVEIADDDPALKAARAEAQKRWPEFVEAFNSRKPGQYFGVKGPFEEGDMREFLWLTVDEIDAEKVHGRLESKPASLKGWKPEQDIHIKVANVDDWLFLTPEKKAVGGFSEKALAEVAKKSKAPATDPPALREPK